MFTTTMYTPMLTQTCLGPEKKALKVLLHPTRLLHLHTTYMMMMMTIIRGKVDANRRIKTRTGIALAVRLIKTQKIATMLCGTHTVGGNRRYEETLTSIACVMRSIKTQNIAMVFRGRILDGNRRERETCTGIVCVVRVIETQKIAMMFCGEKDETDGQDVTDTRKKDRMDMCT